MSRYDGFGLAYVDNYDTSYMDEDIEWEDEGDFDPTEGWDDDWEDDEDWVHPDDDIEEFYD